MGVINLGTINPLSSSQPMINSQNMSIRCQTLAFWGPILFGPYTYYADMCVGLKSASISQTSRKLYLQRANGTLDPTQSIDLLVYDRSTPTSPTILGTGLLGGGDPYRTRLKKSGVTSNSLLNPIDLEENFNIGMQLSTSQQAQLPVGTYSNTFVFVSWSGPASSLISAIEPIIPSIINSCTDFLGNNFTEQSFTVTAKVLAGCSVSVTNINFGDYVGIVSDLDKDGAVNLKCNVNAPYEIQINGGKSGNINARKMYFVSKDGIEDRNKAIPYHIYLPNTQTEWGTTKGSNSHQGTTTSNSTTVKVKAVIRASEANNPVSGTYKDSLVVTTIY
ncbi:spore coat U domain-containing protein [Bartonella sp. HY329]|uniref:Csu type fimbrial protein n=1 Tax=unclassified Bartonella TaxID=2645622 RepID=UPI0021C6D053|nr:MULTISPECIES: spore coat U domain-containing protein [unclassified Bartonella]UXM94734.1 spore coat U domain-containing protein [Bartonella sp. HY329]UXN09057.1 spore coat U domain-containing protein [Bartonella sp. HY328]